jgi:acyl-Coa thioesterase superfamily protein/acyl-CoA thioesterase superfamily protein
VSFFRGDGDVFEPTELTRGPWDPDSQHAGPPAALLGRAIERCGDGEGKHVGRVTVEVLRPVPMTTLTVSAEVVRPGRSVELVEASLADREGEVMLARGWRLVTRPVELEPGLPDEPPEHGPGDGEHKDFFPTGVDVGYHTAMEYRFVTGAYLELGPAVVWMRMLHPLVEGEDPTPLQRVLVAADSGNGVSAALDYHRFLFINTDLTVHLHRGPATEWVCLDAITRLDAAGVGMSDTLLWDERGRIGRAAQTLLVASRDR